MSEKSNLDDVPGVDFVVHADRISDTDVESVLSDVDSIDCYDLCSILSKEIEQRDGEEKNVFRLFHSLTNYHFRPDNALDPFGPMMVMLGERTLVPSDLLVDQIKELAKVCGDFRNVGLRARVSDVVWLRDRKQVAAGLLAFRSYVEALRKLDDGNAVLAFGATSPVSAAGIKILKRACVIANAMGWSKSEFAELRDFIRDQCSKAFEQRDANGLFRIASIDLQRRVSPAGTIAERCREIGEINFEASSFELAKQLYEVAARAYRSDSREEAADDCVKNAASCLVERGRTMSSSAMAYASYLHDAIEYLRPMKGTKARREKLHEELRSVQLKIGDETSTISTPLDLTKIVDGAVSSVSDKPLSSALRSFLFFESPPNPDELLANVRKQGEIAPLSFDMPVTVHDFQGRVVFQSAGSGSDADSSEEHLKYMASRYRDLERRIATSGIVLPIGNIITDQHHLDEDQITLLLSNSPFVPEDHAYIYARGLLHLLGGQSIEAASLLVPQLENSLRHVLGLKGVDTTVVHDGIQTEASLTQLLDKHRLELGAIFLDKYLYELDLLFVFRGGPSLRNQLAHGKIRADLFWNHNIIYGCWLIIHIACIPLLGKWDDFAASIGME